ncbi:hypothetical protein [Ralstonia sp. Ralssp135]|uniref:hypothetical protein n=1 Tax=Ralstonia sp. Ralssp135 TaxID=3243016 RepID=UPI0039AEC7AC
MNDAEALAVGIKAADEALTRNGDNKALAAEDLNKQAGADGTLREALKRVGLLELQSEQAVKH